MIGIISVTKDGDKIGEKLEKELGGKLFLRDHIKNIGLKNITKELFENFQGIVFISSTGIAVRAISDYIKDKTKDPAVVVVDSLGKFSISLLSGHLGGGNSLAKKISILLNNQCIITTATDIKDVVAPDIIAKDNSLIIEDLKKAKDFAAALIEDKKIDFLDDYNLISLPKGYSKYEGFGEMLLWITNKLIGNKNYNKILRLKRRNLVLGIGCRKNTPKDELEEKVLNYLENHNLDKDSVKAIGSIDLKKDEEAIINLKEKLNCDFVTFSKEEISKVKGDFEKSDFVKKITGVPAVCEPSAILLGGQIILPKEKLGGITICVGEIKNG